MELDTACQLPSPVQTPYRTPSMSRSRSRQALRAYEDMSPTRTPPLTLSEGKDMKRRSNGSEVTALDTNISPLDPRRFTPTLHASLVSEILSLRRDLEAKTKDIDQLEQSLHTAQSQNESLNKSVLASNKEVRSVKRQMQLLEGGTLSAINDLSKERDDAVRETTEARRRLEQSQKRSKGHEENAERTQSLWNKEKEQWALERRSLETKVHVVEGRVKAVLEELAHAQAAGSREDLVHRRSHSRLSRSGSPVKQTVGDTRDRRQSTTSVTSENAGGRMSVLSMGTGLPVNLADELALDEIEEVSGIENEYDEGRTSPDALPEERDRPASSLSIKARKILGLPADIEDMEHGERPHSAADGHHGQATSRKLSTRPASYVDSAVQWSAADTLVPAATRGDHQINKFGLVTPLSPNNSDASFPDPDTVWHATPAAHMPVMVSSSCQTIECLPSPPLTPEQNEGVLATIPESAFEKVETKEMATQTEAELQPTRLYRHVHARNQTGDLEVPTIAIIPPASRPATPNSNVVLPPRTKTVSCQVESEILFRYVTSSMQTEEIRVDKRALLSQLMPGALMSSQAQAVTSKGKATAYPRRGSSHSNQPLSNSALKRSAAPIPPVSDDGPLAKDFAPDRSRSIRSSSMFAGLSEPREELKDGFDGDDVFEDEDVFNRPVAKFTLRSGKLVSTERPLDDIGELTAAHAGEALALENLRLSEEVLGLDSLARQQSLQRTTTIRRGQSAASSRSANMRRTAMISNGTAAHQSKHSQSTIGSSDGIPPPISIPLRYSSARMGKSFSEGGRSSRGSSNTSPTRQGRQRLHKPVLRKARSGPALSPAAQASRRQRSKSPPLDARVSIVPEMPMFHMPDGPRTGVPVELVNSPTEASAPRPSVAMGPSRSAQHRKTDSDAVMLQQTSVVDAIAQTMVGEWMFKYVRRRKSFGKPDKDWDPNKSADELINNPSSAGVRHKRWVWLAPYERSIMWSSKQPMNGTALLGKTGRKLTIKSVLDVKDDNPMPKNSIAGPQFNRSILILTPQRALKFTATSQERHYIWLTALSFLSHSPLSFGDLAALPPPPDDFCSPSPPPSAHGSFRRRTLRDSIRIAKAPSRQTVESRSLMTEAPTPVADGPDTRPSTRDQYEPTSDAALPPVIRRYHSRHRSNTAPKAPPSAFRTFSPGAIHAMTGPLSSHSQSATGTEVGSSDRGPYTPSIGNTSFPSTRRGSEASAAGRPTFHNFGYGNHPQHPQHHHHHHNNNNTSFLDSSHNASMTMRMDAFIENKQLSKAALKSLKSVSQPTRSNDARRRDNPYWGFDEPHRMNSSPVESMMPIEHSLRYSGSTGTGSMEKEYFRNF